MITIITGHPRTGTTLALGTEFSKIISDDYFMVGKKYNEPTELHEYVSSKKLEETKSFLDNHKIVVKCPIVGLAFPYIDTSNYDVLAVFRDIRPTIVSVLNHKHNHNIIGDIAFWDAYYSDNKPEGKISRIITSWKLAYESILHAKNLRVLNYGHWENWNHEETNEAPYMAGISDSIIEGEKKSINYYSDKTSNLDLWNELKLAEVIKNSAMEAQRYIIDLYKQKGYELKGLKSD